MTGYDGRGARFDITVVEGNDLSFTVTAVDSDSVAVDLSSATIVGTIYNSDGTAIDTLADSVGGAGSNVITLSLTDTEVDALVDPKSWALVVTRSSDDRTWLAGKFNVVAADRARNGTSGTAVTATVDTNVTVMTSAFTPAAAANVTVADVGGYYTGSTVEAALTEIADGTTLATTYAPLTETIYIPALLWKSAAGTVTEGAALARTPSLAMLRDSIVAAEVVTPSHWNTCSASVRWTQNSGGSGNIRWTIRTELAGDGDTLTQPLADEEAVVAAVPSNAVVEVTGVHTGLDVDPDKVLCLNVVRTTTGDTWGTSALYFLGVYLTRLS